MSIEKMYFNESRIEFSLFRFHFVSAFLYLDYFYKKYPVKQTASLHLKLLLKSTFF